MLEFDESHSHGSPGDTTTTLFPTQPASTSTSQESREGRKSKRKFSPEIYDEEVPSTKIFRTESSSGSSSQSRISLEEPVASPSESYMEPVVIVSLE